MRRTRRPNQRRLDGLGHAVEDHHVLSGAADLQCLVDPAERRRVRRYRGRNGPLHVALIPKGGIMRGVAPILLKRAMLVIAPVVVSLSALADGPAGFGVCVPRSQRVGQEVGCFIVTEQAIGPLGPGPVFWHVTRFAFRDQANAERPTTGTVLEAYGGVWLMTIANAEWRSRRGTHVAAIGPLPIKLGAAYSALYMEASMQPGMKSAVHQHSGPEAWYTLSGETCLETPAGIQVGRASGPQVIVPEGLPMELTATGSTLRQSLVLILHDSSKPPTTPEATWVPRGLCKH
jgi:hypothetical protein